MRQQHWGRVVYDGLVQRPGFVPPFLTSTVQIDRVARTAARRRLLAVNASNSNLTLRRLVVTPAGIHEEAALPGISAGRSAPRDLGSSIGDGWPISALTRWRR